MQELLGQVYGYLRGVWRRRWIVVIVAWVVFVGGASVVLKMPDEYKSSAKLYVDTQSVLRPLLRGIAIQGDVSQQVHLMTKTLFSRPNLEKVARMADLDLNVVNDAQMDRLLNGIKGRASLSVPRKQNIYTIEYRDSNPEVAKRVVQAFLTVFVESSLGSSRKDGNVAQEFIDSQIKDYEARLAAAEELLVEFKRKNMGLMPGSAGGYFGRFEQEKGGLKQAQDRLAELLSRRNEIKNQMSVESPTAGLSSSANVFGEAMNHPLDNRIGDAEKRIDDLLIKYTDKHPDVVALRGTLKRLIDARQKDLDDIRKNNPEVADASPLLQNPVYQQLKISLAESVAEIAAQKTRIDKSQANVDRLNSLVDTVPKVEAEMTRLNRDYGVIKTNYEQLLSRREAARVAQDADATGESVKFDVIEPPRTPLKPSGPDRPLFLAGVLFVGLGLGLGIAFLLSQLKQTFDTRASLRAGIGLPVLGGMSMAWTAQDVLKRRIELGSFAVVSLCLVATFVAVVLFQEILSELIV